jgi:hypothetical protein
MYLHQISSGLGHHSKGMSSENSSLSRGYGFGEKEKENRELRSELSPSRDSARSSIPCQRKTSRRDTTSVQKAKEAQLAMEENRRRSMLEEKKKRVVEKVLPVLSDTKQKQQFWAFAFAHLTRMRSLLSFLLSISYLPRYLMCLLEEHRVKTWAAYWKRKEITAVRIIESYYSFVSSV